jgi:hypothetical protein
LARLVFVGAIVPATYSFVDHELRLLRLRIDSGHTLVEALTMLVFVGQVGLMGWLCGRLLTNPWWRWGLYLWGWVLVDLQLITATISRHGWRSIDDFLPASLLAAQVGLTIVWGILGDTHWAIRLPVCTVVGTLLTMLLDLGYSFAGELFPIQLIALASLCLLLRWRRFRLQRVETDGPIRDANLPSASAAHPGPTGGRMQFNIRHVLIWTTSLAVILGALRFLDLLALEAWTPYSESSIIAEVTGGLVLACVFVVALWAALGSGPLWLRLAMLLVALLSCGFTLGTINYYANFIPNVPYPQPWSWTDDGGYVTWVFLAGSLLAAALVILRVIGYRLVRAAKSPPVPAASRAS